MESKARLAGHPIHQVLVVFPLGLLSTAVLFDILNLVTHDSRLTEASYLMIAVGVVAGLAAAVFGWLDWFAIPRQTRASRIGLLHGAGNVIVLTLFALSWLLRRPDPTFPSTAAVVAAVAGFVLSAVTGWLGGELVDRLGVGVADGAHLDAPSSLIDRRSGAAAAFSGVERRARWVLHPGGRG